MKRTVVVLALSLMSLAATSPARAQVASPPPSAQAAAPATAASAFAPAVLPAASSSPTPPPSPSASATPIAPPTPATQSAQAPNDPRRKSEITPSPVEQNQADTKIRFEADPIGDGALLLGTVGFAALTELVLSTGEIRPQQIDANFNTSNLLGIDRGAISQHIDPHAAGYSNIGLLSSIGFALLDPVLTGFRDGSEAGIVDAFMYAEAATTAWELSDIAKVAVRRPRPIAYIDRASAIAAGANPATYDNTSTDSSLSFFSGHAAVVSSIASAATYIAFARSPGTARPWITLGVGAALTAFVSFERVRSGAHFPTDVMAGALAGTGIGLVVVHVHREDTVQQRPVWVGVTPVNGGGTASISGQF